MEGCGCRGGENLSDCLADNTRLGGVVPLHATFQLTENYIQIVTGKTPDFGALLGRQASGVGCGGGSVGLLVQKRTHRRVDLFVHFSYELPEIRQPGRVAHRYARAGQEEDFARRLGQQEVFRQCRRVVGDLDEPGVSGHGCRWERGLSQAAGTDRRPRDGGVDAGGDV